MRAANLRKQPAKAPAASDLEAELARIAGMNINELRSLWREREGREAPKSFSKDLLARALAYAIQEEQLGGLSPELKKLLANPDAEPPRRIKAGSVIVREYAGARQEVFVVEGGFSWEGRTYPSLSAIAKEITGTRWNGWRFRCTGEAGRGFMKKPSPPKPQRCAIYTRKSTEHNLDLAFNSLDAQREACEAYIKSQAHEGWKLIPTHFDDGGLSGASLDRPARAKRIDIVVVYKVDRLTRSLADFAKLVELFDEHEVSFVSVTQSFNTTSSMGRLTLNVLLSFAQFEREVIGERVRDKIAASKRRGIWVGGMVPLGYRVVNKKLEVVPKRRSSSGEYSPSTWSWARSATSLERSSAKASDPNPASSPTARAKPRSAIRSALSRTCSRTGCMSARSPIAARCTGASTQQSSTARCSTASWRCSRSGASPGQSKGGIHRIFSPGSSLTIAAIR
ncbi:MAG: site-specific recombinase [Chthoniobacter sp.]|nr:site-specific recombinase [Chthoniobacter sp.]